METAARVEEKAAVEGTRDVLGRRLTRQRRRALSVSAVAS